MGILFYLGVGLLPECSVYYLNAQMNLMTIFLSTFLNGEEKSLFSLPLGVWRSKEADWRLLICLINETVRRIISYSNTLKP